jgi:hypothetical protein
MRISGVAIEVLYITLLHRIPRCFCGVALHIDLLFCATFHREYFEAASFATMPPNGGCNDSAISDPSLQPGHGLEVSPAQRRATIANINRQHDIREHPPTHQSAVTLGDITIPIKTTVLPPAAPPHQHSKTEERNADSRDGPMAAFLRATGSALRSGAASLRTVRNSVSCTSCS